MRRWVSIFLLVFLPLQFTWSVAAAYCQHEAGRAAQHFGHHDHQHHVDEDGSTDAKALNGGIDGDCAVCHASCVAVLTGFAQPPIVLPVFEGNLWWPVALPSPPSAVPERPNWTASA